MSRTTTDFAKLVTGFLTDYLPRQRNYSKNTIVSYKDAIKLFAVFLTEEKGFQLSNFTLKKFDRQIVIDYLDWLRCRGDSISTTNQRLAALKTFAEYASLEEIEQIAPLQSIQSIKSRKTAARELEFLTVEQVHLLVNRPDVNTRNGLRHRAALTLLYDSGCRVQELCDLMIRDVYTGKSPTVRLHGKGNKYRTVTISDNTAGLISEYINRQRNVPMTDQPLIVNANNRKMSRDGVNYIIGKYASEIRREGIPFPEKLSAHCLRHSKAMHMLAAGINIVYIRDFLGHADVSTTMIYARADNRIKNEVINKLAPKVTEETDLPDWTQDGDLMAFLRSFQ